MNIRATKTSDRFLPWLIALLAAIALLAVPLATLLNRRPDLIWTAINVNSGHIQSDAHLIRITGQADILIDTGHPVYAADLFQFINSRGIKRLDAVIISHAHSDHYGGLVFLLRNGIAVDEVYLNVPPRELVEREHWGCATSEIEEIRSECAIRRIPIIEMTDSSRWLFERDISLQVLYVFDGVNTPIGPTDINDTSAVMMLTHGRLKFLFSGDLNRPLGRYITQRAGLVPLNADILKAPHHGAEGLPDDEFFHAVNPRAMIVPAPAALWSSERYDRIRRLAEGIPTYVNGLHGHITVKSDGQRYTIETGEGKTGALTSLRSQSETPGKEKR